MIAILPVRPAVREDREQPAGGRGARRPGSSFTDAAGAASWRLAAERLRAADGRPFVAPILYAIAVQLLAYHVAVLKGTDVDQPRNLAKSVTVE